MRGTTLRNTFIIADEMQNASPLQMKMLLTRLDETSKIVILGDTTQSDFAKEIMVKDGLTDLIHRLSTQDNEIIQHLQFQKSDIQRSELTSYICDLYEENDVEKVPKYYSKDWVTLRKGGETDAAMIPLKHY